MLIFYILKFYIFLVFFELFENMCHTMRAIGQTLKEKEKLFFVLLKMSVTRYGRPDRQNKAKRTFFIFYIFFSIFFAIFDNFQIFCFFINKKKRK